MAEQVWLTTPVELIKTAGTSSDIQLLVGSGEPDGNTAPESSAAKASIYFRDDATDDCSPIYVKVDASSADDDWVQLLVSKGEGNHTIEGDWTFSTDKKIYFRDTGIYMHSSGDGDLTITADGHIYIGDGTNQVDIQPDGEIQLEGTAKVTKNLVLPLITGGGTSNIEAWNAAPSINFDADGETFYASFQTPNDWDAASDLTYHMMVANEIAEDDGDDVSFTLQVRGYADGETTSDAGQSVAVSLNLTGGDQAINVINEATGTVDYDDGTYPIAAGDTVVIEGTVNLGDGTECTGPLHIVDHWITYTADKLGTAT